MIQPDRVQSVVVDGYAFDPEHTNSANQKIMSVSDTIAARKRRLTVEILCWYWRLN